MKLANPSLVLLLTKNYSFLKQKTQERKLLCCQINQSRALFSFPSCACYISPNHGTCLCKRTSPQVPTASSMEWLNVLLICKLSVKAFCNAGVAICFKNVLYFRKKISMHLSGYEKSVAYWQICQNFQKLYFSLE